MKKIEVENEQDIKCPKCGEMEIIDEKKNVCNYLRFIVTNEGIEYCSDKIDKEELENEVSEMGVDKATDNLKQKEIVKFSICQSAPSFHGAYRGYATE